MKRQSGYCLLGVVFLASCLIVRNADRNSESAPPLRLIPGSIDDSGYGTHLKPDSRTCGQSKILRIAPQRMHAILHNLARGARIVIGSLDVSGARHEILLTPHVEGVRPLDSLPAVRGAIGEILRGQHPEDTLSLMSMTQQHALGLSSSDYRSPTDNAASVDGLRSVTQSQRRVFLTPHFGDTGTIHEPAECQVIGETSRVRVYLDEHSMTSEPADRIIALAERLTLNAELHAIPIVEAWVGTITDVDHDQKLSIVITDLDLRTQLSSRGSPIYGCIREADYDSDADFGGDVIYLDSSILELPRDELLSLLTHEMTHAAICSLQPGELYVGATEISGARRHSANRQIPPWLNEAVAHLMELQCSGQDPGVSGVSQNFRRRIDEFFANPACSPIVANEYVMSLEERRSGSRAAATLFLASWLTSPDILQSFLRSEADLDCRIETLARKRFEDVFREWTLLMATTTVENRSLSVDSLPADRCRQQYSLIGTAFRCFECSDDVASLVISCDDTAQLQISVIEPERNTTTMTSVTTGPSELPYCVSVRRSCVTLRR